MKSKEKKSTKVDALRKLREDQATKTKPTKTAKVKSDKAPKAEKKAAVKKETISVPDKFVRSFGGKDHKVEKVREGGWSVDGDAVPTLREAMIAILKAHKKDVGHRAASYFFANVKTV